ncbi:MAG: hypothetical protein WA485_03215 [Candidatus Sulfotelmatobacter sp.]
MERRSSKALLNRKSIMRLAVTICVAEFAFRWVYFRGRQDYYSIYHRFDALIYGAIAHCFSITW